MNNQPELTSPQIHIERRFPRFSLSQRWEHTLLLLSFTILLLTGLPQKYRNTDWSQQILATPERVQQIRSIHHIAAILLTLEAVYHVGKAVTLMVRRKLPGDMLITLKDVRDAWHMIQYLFFLKKDQPKFGKYNFEQKITYWFLLFGIGILIVTGFVIWFPTIVTRVLPGGVVPAAKMAHSTEAIVAAVFIVIWHFYHVHIQRLNLSIFTGKLSEQEMRAYHQEEFERITSVVADEERPANEART
jgi:formate dehydrogenase gamma subunit